jgi:FlaA1/EpsC-like NDP-sugar epimerase
MRELAMPGETADDSDTSRGAARRLPLIHFAADSALWAVAFPMSIWLRYDYSISKIGISALFAMIGAIGLQGEFGWFLGQYRRRWRYGSFDEIRAVGLAAIATGAVLVVLLWNERTIPRSVPILATGFSLLGHITTRSFWRLYKEKQNRPEGHDLTRLVVVGAGDGAAQIIQIMTSTSTSLFVPVGIVDDDRGKRNLQISGVDVLGTVEQLPEIAGRFSSLFRVPTADSSGRSPKQPRLSTWPYTSCRRSINSSATSRQPTSDRWLTKTYSAVNLLPSTPPPSRATSPGVVYSSPERVGQSAAKSVDN